jgi:hypothetical protein
MPLHACKRPASSPARVSRVCRWEGGSLFFLNTVSVFLQYGGTRLAAQHVHGTAGLNYHAMGQHGARPLPLTYESLRQDEFDFNFRCPGEKHGLRTPQWTIKKKSYFFKYQRGSTQSPSEVVKSVSSSKMDAGPMRAPATPKSPPIQPRTLQKVRSGELSPVRALDGHAPLAPLSARSRALEDTAQGICSWEHLGTPHVREDNLH